MSRFAFDPETGLVLPRERRIEPIRNKRLCSLIAGAGPMFFGAAAASLPTVTWNPSDKDSHISLSNGNLTLTRDTSSGAFYGVRATRGIDIATGSGYFEIFCGNGSNTIGPFTLLGIALATTSLTVGLGNDVSVSSGWAYYEGDGGKNHNGSLQAYGTAYGSSQIIGVTVKYGSLWFARNGTWQNGGDPAAGTGAAYTGLTGTVYPMVTTQAGSPYVEVYTGRFKSADFTYAAPSGINPWGG